MRNSLDPKSQYVDVSYGWQGREEVARLNRRRRRWRWLVSVGMFAAAAIVALLWWLK